MCILRDSTTWAGRWPPAGPCRLPLKASAPLFRRPGLTFRWFSTPPRRMKLAPAQASLSVEQKDLLDFAKPSQVLITQAFYDRIAHYQPALRTFPLRAGVYEFLWTSEQRLDELQAEAEFMPTLIQPPTATEAFDETVVVPVIKPAPEPRWKAPDPAPVPAAHSRD